MKRKSKSVMKGMMTFMLTGAMVLGAVPFMPVSTVAYANTPAEKAITCLGAGAIGNPTNGNGGWSKVYFGSKDTPILFNVLKNGETHFTSADNPTLLLDCADILENRARGGFIWADSGVRTWLNGDFINNRFSASEIAAIASSTKENMVEGYDGNGMSDNWGHLEFEKLKDDQIFLLDAKEITNESYGFANTAAENDTRVKTLNNENKAWMLRSQLYNDMSHVYKGGGYVFDDGKIAGGDSSTLGVSPAFNVDLSSVIFSSLITAGTYKLTVLDQDMSVSCEGVAQSGTTVTVPYKITGNDADKATRVSVVVTADTWSDGNGWSSTGAPLQYTKLSVDSLSAAGTGTFELDTTKATGTWGSDYHVYLVAEAVGAGNATDCASKPAELHVHNFTYAVGTGDDADTLTATCEKAGCPLTDNKVSLVINAPTLSAYGGSGEATASLEGRDDFNTATGKNVSESDIRYLGRDGTNYEESATAPTGIGKYTAKITVEGKTASVDYEIEGGTIIASAEDVAVSYNGQPHYIVVDVTKPASGATVKYGNTEGTYDLDSSPAITDVSESPKTVYYQVTADNYKAYTGSATITINKTSIAENDITPPAKIENLTYNGSPLALVSGGSITGDIGKMKYYSAKVEDPNNPPTAPADASLYTITIPAATNAGTYYVWYKVGEAGNHKDTDPAGPVSVIISKGTYEDPTLAAEVKKGTSGKVDLKSRIADGAELGAVTVKKGADSLDGEPSLSGTVLSCKLKSGAKTGDKIVIAVGVGDNTNCGAYAILLTITVTDNTSLPDPSNNTGDNPGGGTVNNPGGKTPDPGTGIQTDAGESSPVPSETDPTSKTAPETHTTTTTATDTATGEVTTTVTETVSMGNETKVTETRAVKDASGNITQAGVSQIVVDTEKGTETDIRVTVDAATGMATEEKTVKNTATGATKTIIVTTSGSTVDTAALTGISSGNVGTDTGNTPGSGNVTDIVSGGTVKTITVAETTASGATEQTIYKLVSSGSANISLTGVSGSASGAVEIPAEVEAADGTTYTVTEISPRTFAGSTTVTDIVIPATVTHIGQGAFRNVKSTETFTMTVAKAGQLKIDKNAFRGLKKGTEVIIYARNKNQFNKTVAKIKKAGGTNLTFTFQKM